MGGALGILIGVGASQIVSQLNGWPVQVSSASIIVAFVFSGAVGIGFGFYPAHKAAKLDPIEALRFE
jgi:putative ABC transport system permease protein